MTMMLAAIPFAAHAADNASPLRLAVQPVLPQQQTRQAWQPLADFLAQVTGRQIEIVTSPNFLVFWQKLRKPGNYDLVLAGAHLIDFLIQRLDYRPVARIPGQVSYTLVTGKDELIFEPQELVGKRIAGLGSPSLGALRVAELFPNPMQQPQIIEARDSRDAAEAVLNKRANAAIIPSPLVGDYPDLNTVTTTSPVPHIGLVASPEIPEETLSRMREALLNAANDPLGKRMLEKINMPGFIALDPRDYAGTSKLLQGVWGY